YCGRSLFRAIDGLCKHGRTRQSSPIVAADITFPVRPADSDENPMGGPAEEGAYANSTNEPETAPSAGPAGEPAEQAAYANLTNEPETAPSAGPAGEPAGQGAYANLTNEPGTAPGVGPRIRYAAPISTRSEDNGQSRYRGLLCVSSPIGG